MTTVPLNRLRFGDDYPEGSINARRTKSEEGLPELLASILACGLIYPLIVKSRGSKVYVAEGNRRLAAMRLGVQQRKLEKNFEVRVEEMAEEVDALELSLTANIMRLPMHEVDQYETFVTMRDRGASVGEIASRFGTSELVVNRRLALGSLSPKLRQAWREEKIDADDAKAFTVVSDHALQDQVYTSLAQGQMLQRHSILRALTRSDIAGAADLRFVGKTAYVAAGGRLVEDLFVEEAHVLDPEILKRLEREKIEAACQDLLAEGWAWAALGNELPNDRYRWTRLAVDVRFTDDETKRLEELQPLVDARSTSVQEFKAREAARVEQDRIRSTARIRSYTAEDKASSGCVLSVSYEGTLRVEHGYVRPGSDLGGQLPAGASTSELEREPTDKAGLAGAGPEISGALAQTVSEWTTIAAAKALADEPDVALRVLLAALQSYGSPARFSRNGWSGLHEAMADRPAAAKGSFSEALADALRSRDPHLKAAIAEQVARSLDLTAAAAANPGHAVKGALPLIDALDAEGYLTAAREAFDASVYFDRAPAAVALAAIAEMGGPKPTGKKGLVALAAADLARAVGWLPQGMRSSVYTTLRAPAAPAADHAAARIGRSRAKAPSDATAPA